MSASDDFAQAAEIVPGVFYFVWVKRPDSARCSPIAHANIAYSIDEELVYEPFFADFGPLNLGKTYRFCAKTQHLLAEAQRTGKKLYFYTGPHAHFKANAAVLVGIYSVLYLNKTADDAYKPLLAFKPYVPFRDPSCGVSTFHLTVLDCIKGIQKARDVGFIDWNSGHSKWSLEEYEHYEQVENGDLNWIVPGKFVAFSGPAARSNEIAGYRLHTPEDYWDYFRRKGVTTIVRLNKKVYERKRFLDGGFKHHEMYFPDGSCPSDAILQRFLETVEAEPGCIAVHCKAGLGRTGVLICSYIMKHYKFTTEEVIGYIRICRPGSVIGPQQNYLREVEARLWHEGDMYRASRGLKAPSAASDLVVAGKSPVADSPSFSGATNNNVLSPYQPALSRVGSANQARAGYGSAGSMSGNDMSLMQYSQQYVGSQPAAPMSQHHVPSSAPAPTASLVGGGVGGSASSVRNRYGHRSITPLRYGVSNTNSSPAPSIVASYGVSMSHPAPLSSARSVHTPSSNNNSASVTRSMPSMPASGRAPSADRSSISRGLSSASLRATLHTDTLQAADRPRAVPERNAQSADITNSNNHGSWKLSTPSYGVSTGAASGRAPSAGRGVGISNAKTSSSSTSSAGILGVGSQSGGVARVLAPNGQPRKVPVAMLSQYQNTNAARADLSSASAGVKATAHLRYGLSSK